MRRWTKSVVIFFLIFTIFGSLTALTTLAQGDVQLRVDPSLAGLKPGDHFRFSIQLENVTDLYGAEVHLKFNPAVLDIQDAAGEMEGIQCEAGEVWKDGFTAVNKADNGSGQIDFAATLLNPAPAVSGNVILFNCEALGKGLGATEIAIENAILATREGTQIAFVQQSGRVEVTQSGKTSGGEQEEQITQGLEVQTEKEGGMIGEEGVDIKLIAAAGAGIVALFIAVILALRTGRKKES